MELVRVEGCAERSRLNPLSHPSLTQLMARRGVRAHLMAEREAMLAQFSAELEGLDADVQVRLHKSSVQGVPAAGVDNLVRGVEE